jgi:hypothetical protein
MGLLPAMQSHAIVHIDVPAGSFGGHDAERLPRFKASPAMWT